MNEIENNLQNDIMPSCMLGGFCFAFTFKFQP